MHLRSLSLRNYRVYRSVDLEFPDGLIGIYGANGSGKSTLIEALRWALYGDSRTDKWELRSAGSATTCGSSWCSSTRATPMTCGGG
jgi:DNA repair protein SbcC/Rad50